MLHAFVNSKARGSTLPPRARQIFFALLLGNAIPAHGANSYRLNASSSVTVSEHGVCRTLTNGPGADYLVPTKTSTEWQAFLANLPSGVSIGDCCPTGYVLVPEVPSKGTPEFCVMKWEARNVSNTATATSSGQPWNYVTKATAISKCAALGTNYALVTNDQHTAMLRDIESVDANWSGGSRGVGCLFTGNSNVNNNCGYNGAQRESGEANTKARFTFSNGREIWHLNGNLSEWVQGTVSTSSPARTSSNFYMGARAANGYSKLPSADRTSWGPLYDDYGSGCGSGDNTPNGNCGLGYYMATNGHAYITRGGEADDNRWDAFTMETSSTDMSYVYIGFRCAYNP